MTDIITRRSSVINEDTMTDQATTTTTRELYRYQHYSIDDDCSLPLLDNLAFPKARPITTSVRTLTPICYLYLLPLDMDKEKHT